MTKEKFESAKELFEKAQELDDTIKSVEHALTVMGDATIVSSKVELGYTFENSNVMYRQFYINDSEISASTHALVMGYLDKLKTELVDVKKELEEL